MFYDVLPEVLLLITALTAVLFGWFTGLKLASHLGLHPAHAFLGALTGSAITVFAVLALMSLIIKTS